jgi:hypothetical protein
MTTLPLEMQQQHAPCIPGPNCRSDADITSDSAAILVATPSANQAVNRQTQAHDTTAFRATARLPAGDSQNFSSSPDTFMPWLFSSKAPKT